MKPDSASSPPPGRTGTIVMAVALAAALAWIARGYLTDEPAREAPAAAPVALTAPAAAPAPAPASASPAPAAAAAPATAAAPVAPADAAPGVAQATAAAAAPAPAAPAAQPDPTIPPDPATAAAAGTPERSAVRGVIKPRDEVLYSSKIAARISQMPYKEGERFKKGAVLVAFDCSRLRAELNAAWAANRASQQLLRQNMELDSYNAIGKSEVQIARAKADQSASEAGALQAQLQDCSIVAPFSGIVVEKKAQQHENAAPGQELTRVLNDDDLEVHLIAPSNWLSWLRVGTAFSFKVDETGRTHAGKVARLGASVDPVSQTVRLVGVFTAGRDGVLPGMSGSASFADSAPNAESARSAAAGGTATP